MTKITVIGGGTGLSVLLRGIKDKFNNISAIVSVADDGGNSGRLREDLGMLPPGDVRNCLVALADEEVGMEDLFNHRFKDGDLKGQNIGNLLLAAYNEMHGDFEEAISKISNILKVKGKVIPVTTDNVVLCAELDNGNVVIGESNIPVVAERENSPIKRIYPEQKRIKISENAVNAINEADVIIFGPGSLYTSIIANFLTEGIVEALNQSNACKIYVGNVMTQPGETTDYSLKKHVDEIIKFIGEGNIDFVIANNKEVNSQEIERYISGKSNQILPDKQDRDYLKEKRINFVENNFIETKQGYIRHDASKVGDVIKIIMEE